MHCPHDKNYRLATIKLDHGGKVLEKVKEKDVETIVPSTPGTLCMVVHGRDKGLMGSVVERRSDEGKVVLQMQEDLSVLNKYSLDEVSMVAVV